jgi:uncharacterized Zn-finger protein
VHIWEKLFRCSECPKAFGYFSNLKRHLRVHTGDKTFSAQIVCPRSWIAETSSSTRRRKTLPLLLVYNVIWTGQWINGSYKSSHWIETYSCSQCTKSSAWSTKLQQHIRIHSGEKPYICMKCQKAFSRSEKFKLQMKRHDLKKVEKLSNVT